VPHKGYSTCVACHNSEPSSQHTRRLGIALLCAGDKGRAAQVLKTVGGTDGTADLARLWKRVS